MIEFIVMYDKNVTTTDVLHGGPHTRLRDRSDKYDKTIEHAISADVIVYLLYLEIYPVKIRYHN